MRKRRGVPPALWLIVLIALISAGGCGGSGGPGAAVEGNGGSDDAAGPKGSTSIESASAHENLPQERTGQYDRPRASERRSAEGSGSPGGAYVPAGFGEGSLWATDLITCNDSGEAPPPGEHDGAGAGAAACSAPASMYLKKLDPETGEEEAAIELDGFFANITEVAFGAGSVWVSSADYYPGPVDPAGSGGDAVLRVDPATNRVVDRTPLPSPSGVAFGHGSVWVTSAGRGTVSRVNPETGGVTAQIEVGRGAVDVAADERGGAVWVAGLHLPDGDEGYPPPEYSEYRKLTRINPETNRIVAEVPIEPGSPEGGAQSVAVGEGSVWATSVGGELSKVDPRTDEVLAVAPLGDYSSHLAVSGDSVWATAQTSAPGNVRSRLVRVDPRDLRVVRTEDLGSVEFGGYGRIAASDGNVWFVRGDAQTGSGTLKRISR